MHYILFKKYIDIKDVVCVYLPGPLGLPSGPSLSPLPALPGPSHSLSLPCVGLNIWNKARQAAVETQN